MVAGGMRHGLQPCMQVIVISRIEAQDANMDNDKENDLASFVSAPPTG